MKKAWHWGRKIVLPTKEQQQALKHWAKEIADGKLRSDLTEEQKLEAARIGRIQFVSDGAVRKAK